MKYKTLIDFTDLEGGIGPDGQQAGVGRVYRYGDAFPIDGVSVGDERLAALSSDSNRRNTPLIAVVPEAPEEPEAAKPPKKEKAKK